MSYPESEPRLREGTALTATLVIRFGALGDLCICSWFLAGLSRRTEVHPLTLVTKKQFRGLAAEIPGVDHVATLEASGPGSLLRLACEVRTLRPATVLDAHAVLRSRLLTLLAGRSAENRLVKDTAARLKLLRHPGAEAPDAPHLRRHLLDRLDDLAEGAPGRSLLTPTVTPPLAHLRPAESGRKRTVGIAPGARWPTKRWPDKLFHAAALELLEEGVDLKIFLGPGETAWFDHSPLFKLTANSSVEIIRDSDLVTVARSLASCRVTLCNDSGLLHLSEAVGTPVVSLFGPTVAAFGYAPLLPESCLVETDLDCRPCSRTGSRPCHRGDLACLTGIAPAVVVAHIRKILEVPL